MKTIIYTLVNVNYDTYLDDYNEGELEHVISGEQSYNKRFKNITDLITYLKETCANEDWFIDENKTEDSVLIMFSDKLVDVNNYDASEFEIEKWKQGKKKLYNMHQCALITVEYIETIPVNEINEIIKNAGLKIC